MIVEYPQALEDNYIYVYRYDGLKALVVDPGDVGGRVLDRLF